MKRLSSDGYTIIEVMIFLVISGGMMGSAMLLVNDRLERTRFSQAVLAFEQKLKDQINDVSTGYYPTTASLANNFQCISAPAPANTLSFVSSGSEQGSNAGCVFLGKAFQLPTSDSPNYSIFTMAASKNATSLTNANTELLGTGGNPGNSTNETIDAEINIRNIVSLTDQTRSIHGMAVVSDFSQTSTLDNSVTGNAARVTLYEILNNFNANAGTDSMVPIQNGLVLCLQQGSGGREGAIVIGANGQSSVESLVNDRHPEC